jgi:hypothetical protein
MTGLINAYIADAKAVSRWVVEFTRWCRYYWPLGIIAFPIFIILCWVVIRIPMLYVESVSKSYSSREEEMQKYSIDRNPYLYIPVSFHGRRLILRSDFIDPYNLRASSASRSCTESYTGCTLSEIVMTFYFDPKRGDFCTAWQRGCPVRSGIENYVRIHIKWPTINKGCNLEYSKDESSLESGLPRSFGYRGDCYGYEFFSYGGTKYAKSFGEPGGFLERYLTALETGNYDWLDK